MIYYLWNRKARTEKTSRSSHMKHDTDNEVNQNIQCMSVENDLLQTPNFGIGSVALVSSSTGIV